MYTAQAKFSTAEPIGQALGVPFLLPAARDRQQPYRDSLPQFLRLQHKVEVPKWGEGDPQ